MLNDDEVKRLKQLRRTRSGYEAEGILHSFLMDAYTGGGGFQNGIIPSPEVPLWGRRAYERGRSAWLLGREDLFRPTCSDKEAEAARQSDWSYLVAYHGEDMDSYRDRLRNCSYSNPVAKVVDVSNGLLLQDAPIYERIPDQLTSWLPISTLDRLPMQSHIQATAKRGQIVGFSGSFVDMPALAANNYLESVQLGLLPYVLSFYPQDITDWDIGADGKLTAAKIVTVHEHKRQSLLDEKAWEEHILLLYPDRWERYRLLLKEPDGSGNDVAAFLTPWDKPDTGPNPFGEVPLIFFAWDDGLGGLVRWGMPQIFNIAKIAWRMFNEGSELTSVLRGQTFSTLVLPQNEGNAVKGNQPVGIGGAIREPIKARGIIRYVAPPSGPAQAYETRLANEREQIHSIAGIDSGSGKYSETAEAMRIRFQQTEMMLVNASARLGQHELKLLRLAGRGGFRLPEATLERMNLARSESFDVDRYANQLDEAIKAMDMPWPKSVLKALLKRTTRSILPNVTQKDLQDMDREIDNLVDTKHEDLLGSVLTKSQPPQPTPNEKQQDGKPPSSPGQPTA